MGTTEESVTDPEDGAEKLSHLRAKLLAAELKKEIKEDFLSHVKTLLWVCAIVFALGTLGGIYSIRGLIDQRVEEAISENSASFQRITEQALEEVIELRVKTNAALADTKAIEGEMGREVEKAKRLILETMRYWEAAKPAIDNVAQPELEEPKLEAESDWTGQLMKCLRRAGVTDADVLLFSAVIDNNVEAVKEAMDLGGDPIVTVEEILDRHRAIVAKNCPRYLR